MSFNGGVLWSSAAEALNSASLATWSDFIICFSINTCHLIVSVSGPDLSSAADFK
jgi:hypothetical protein